MKVFLSYAKSDEKLARKIGDGLSQAFKNRLIPVIVGSPDKIQRNSVPWILWRLQTINLPEHGNQRKAIQQIAQRLAQAA